MKIKLLSLFLFPVCTAGFSQEWKTIESNDLISVHAAEMEHKSPSDGIHHQRLVFRYENHTSDPVELRFNREVQYDNTTLKQEQDFVITIPGNGSLQYDAAKQYDKTYYIFKKDHEGVIKRSLQDYKITNLRINRK